jgi:hypothetical protein
VRIHVSVGPVFVTVCVHKHSTSSSILCHQGLFGFVHNGNIIANELVTCPVNRVPFDITELADDMS